MRDPLGNSFVSARLGSFIPPESDPNISMNDFTRTWEENEDLGLNHMNTKDFETGVDYDDASIVLPDRLTHVVVKGEDHPTLFAKGCAGDSTPSGVFFSSGTSAQSSTALEDVIPIRRHIDDDSNRKFEAREEFAGKRAGFFFRLGSQGLGYYEDLFALGEATKDVCSGNDVVDGVPPRESAE